MWSNSTPGGETAQWRYEGRVGRQ